MALHKISKKGNQVAEAQLFNIALTAARNQGYTEVAIEENQCALFTSNDGAYHLVVAPAYDYYDQEQGRRLINRMTDLKDFLKKHDLELGYPNERNLHVHYFLAQTKGTRHYVYGYVDPTGRLKIKDSFPDYKYNPHKKYFMEKIPKNPQGKHKYINTGAQYNNSDCGHYALLYFKEDIGARAKPSFLNRHSRKIGFVAGCLVIGTLLTLGLVFSGFTITPVIIGLACASTLVGGICGSLSANAFDSTLYNERIENAKLLKQFHYPTQENKNGQSPTFGSNVAEQLDELSKVTVNEPKKDLKTSQASPGEEESPDSLLIVLEEDSFEDPVEECLSKVDGSCTIF